MCQFCFGFAWLWLLILLFYSAEPIAIDWSIDSEFVAEHLVSSKRQSGSASKKLRGILTSVSQLGSQLSTWESKSELLRETIGEPRRTVQVYDSCDEAVAHLPEMDRPNEDKSIDDIFSILDN